MEACSQLQVYETWKINETKAKKISLKSVMTSLNASGTNVILNRSFEEPHRLIKKVSKLSILVWREILQNVLRIGD